MSRRSRDKIASTAHDIGEFISRKVFLKLPFGPTQLNLLSFLFMLLAAVFFALGQWKYNFLALFFIVLSVQIDYADGIVARERQLTNRFGAWFDPFLDLIGQHLLYIGICFGVFKRWGFDTRIVLLSFLGFWSLALNNFIGLEFNRNFGFESYTGLSEFVERFKSFKKNSFWDDLLFNTINPSSFIYFVLYTIRYFIILGAITNKMIFTVVLITVFGLIRGFLMVGIFVSYLRENKKNKVISLLLDLDKNKRK